MRKYRNWVICWSLFLLVLAGCRTLPPIPAPLTRMEVLERFNSNVAALGAFKASIFEWDAKIVDEQGKKQRHRHLGGSVRYVPPEEPLKPSSFFLSTRAPIGEAMVVGSNEEEYWMYIKPLGKGWWGKYEHQDKKCADKMMINPQAFLEFIGLRQLPTQPVRPGYKVGREQNILEFIELVDGGYWIRREIIIDRRDNLPKEVRAYGENGKLILQSWLGKYKQLGQAWVPSEIRVIEKNGDEVMLDFRLKLWNFKMIDKDDRKLSILLRRPRKIKGIDDYQQIDQECENIR